MASVHAVADVLKGVATMPEAWSKTSMAIQVPGRHLTGVGRIKNVLPALPELPSYDERAIAEPMAVHGAMTLLKEVPKDLWVDFHDGWKRLQLEDPTLTFQKFCVQTLQQGIKTNTRTCAWRCVPADWRRHVRPDQDTWAEGHNLRSHPRTDKPKGPKG